MSKKGVYFTKKTEEKKTEKPAEEGPKKRKGLTTALVLAAFLLAAIFVYIVVCSKGTANLVLLLLVMAVLAVCVEFSWASPDRKSFVLWKKLFNKE